MKRTILKLTLIIGGLILIGISCTSRKNTRDLNHGARDAVHRKADQVAFIDNFIMITGDIDILKGTRLIYTTTTEYPKVVECRWPYRNPPVDLMILPGLYTIQYKTYKHKYRCGKIGYNPKDYECVRLLGDRVVDRGGKVSTESSYHEATLRAEPGYTYSFSASSLADGEPPRRWLNRRRADITEAHDHLGKLGERCFKSMEEKRGDARDGR